MRPHLPLVMSAVFIFCLSGDPAAADAPIPSARGTAVIDGVKSPGEWDTATPRSVFFGLTGSVLYVMDDDVNIYLGLFVPDTTLRFDDLFWTRFDAQHDGITTLLDDEVDGSGQSTFFDSHWSGSNWANTDMHRDGLSAAGPAPGGSFFEISHPLNDGDPQDLFVGPGDTIGLCVFYMNDGTLSGLDVYPANCLGSDPSQTTYVDYRISMSTIGVEGDRVVATARLSLVPNPLRRGVELAIHYSVPDHVTRVALGIGAPTWASAGAAHSDMAIRQERDMGRMVRSPRVSYWTIKVPVRAPNPS